MDFKVKRLGESDSKFVVAVPSHEDGAFVVKHDEYYGTRVYKEMEITDDPALVAAVEAGENTAVQQRIEANTDRPGYHTLVRGAGRVSITVAGSGNIVSGRVTEFLELAPAVPVHAQ